MIKMKIYNTDFDILVDIARLIELYSPPLRIVWESGEDNSVYRHSRAIKAPRMFLQFFIFRKTCAHSLL